MESLRSKEETLDEKVTEFASFPTVPSFSRENNCGFKELTRKNKKTRAILKSILQILKDKNKHFILSQSKTNLRSV